MASRRAAIPAKHLFNGFRPVTATPSPCPHRFMATEAPLPPNIASQAYADAPIASTPTSLSTSAEGSINPATTSQTSTRFQAQPNPFLTTTQCTVYSFPSFEPTRIIAYPSTHLGVPLRKDILHRAVIYEGDNTRAGLASTKWRSEVHGSGRKLRPQKGTGHARLGDRKSPMLRGGGVAHGPHPRDFGTELPAKIYDLAWRTALSYRYAKGELILLDGAAELQVHEASRERFMKDLLMFNKMGGSHGRTLFVTAERREGLSAALEGLPKHARAVTEEDVDVKDLLELGRLVVERRALDRILQLHERDLAQHLKLQSWKPRLAQEVPGT